MLRRDSERARFREKTEQSRFAHLISSLDFEHTHQDVVTCLNFKSSKQTVRKKPFLWITESWPESILKI